MYEPKDEEARSFGETGKAVSLGREDNEGSGMTAIVKTSLILEEVFFPVTSSTLSGIVPAGTHAEIESDVRV